MPRIVAGFGLLALIFALTAGFAKPASAEFFGCDDQRSARTSSYRSYSRVPSYSSNSHYTHEFAAQTSRSVTFSRRSYRGLSDQWH